MLVSDAVLTITPDKPVAGGRMLARHEGRVILVAGAIPGEPVRARIERVDRSMAWATVVEVLEAHPARRTLAWDSRCGGSAYAHIAYDTQLSLKADLIRDALVRIGRVPWSAPIAMTGSPESGYRMRSRLHIRHGRLGFFLEGTHTVCDARPTGQLLPATADALDELGVVLEGAGLAGHADVDVSENIAADRRAVHVQVDVPVPPDVVRGMPRVGGITGLGCSGAVPTGEGLVYGEPWVDDTLHAGNRPVHLRRHVRAFFQGNRYLLPTLVAKVLARCEDGPVVDLYAGAGLFSVTLAAAGCHRVIAVEGDRIGAADLRANAERNGGAIETRAVAVEAFLASASGLRAGVLILDPPRTGMSRLAAEGAVRLKAPRVVFVSCDAATFARDVRRFVDAGYRLTSVEGLDLFPNTPHVEVLAVLDRD